MSVQNDILLFYLYMVCEVYTMQSYIIPVSIKSKSFFNRRNCDWSSYQEVMV